MKVRNFRRAPCTIDFFDQTQRFVQQKLAIYMNRLLIRCGALDRLIFEMLGWLLGPARIRDLLDRVSAVVNNSGSDYSGDETIARDLELDRFMFAHLMEGMLGRRNARLESSLVALIADLLKGRIRELHNSGRSQIEKSLLRLKKIFRLNPVDTELCLFLFIVSVWDEARQLFVNHLKSDDRLSRYTVSAYPGWIQRNYDTGVGISRTL